MAKTFDALGWFAPVIVKVKILLQRLWEAGIGWDDPVPLTIQEAWEMWRSQLPERLIPRCYYLVESRIVSLQIHGFSDALESAYAGVVYLRMLEADGTVHVLLVIAKTKVAPLKRLTIPRLELCGADLSAGLLHRVKGVLGTPYSGVFAWTDSTSWLCGSSRRFKAFVGNRVSHITLVALPNSTPALSILKRFSSFTSLCNVTAWIFRFISRCRKTPNATLNHLTVD